MGGELWRGVRWPEQERLHEYHPSLESRLPVVRRVNMIYAVIYAGMLKMVSRVDYWITVSRVDYHHSGLAPRVDLPPGRLLVVDGPAVGAAIRNYLLWMLPLLFNGLQLLFAMVIHRIFGVELHEFIIVYKTISRRVCLLHHQTCHVMDKHDNKHWLWHSFENAQEANKMGLHIDNIPFASAQYLHDPLHVFRCHGQAQT